MDADQTFDDQVIDEPPGQSMLDMAEPVLGRDARLLRLEEYELDGLEKDNPLEATLTFVNADMMNLAILMGGVLKDSLSVAPATTDSFRQIEPSLNMYLRVTRQIDRFAHLEYQLTTAQHLAQDAKKGSQSTEMLAHMQQASRRRH
jgi:hypothetical protein